MHASLPVVIDLHSTVIACWRERLVRDWARERSHWRTKIAYYRAAAALTGAAGGRAPSWRAVVGAVRPQGNRTTFYEVAGDHARHPMLRALTGDGRLDAMQLALAYRRADAVGQLLDETKVWSYWPYREELLRRYATAPPGPGEAEQQLRAALLAWADGHPGLAAALDFAPPACAVEDLVVLGGGRTMALRAAAELAGLLAARR